MTVLGSETFDSDLGIVYSKTGLDIATADKFSKTNKVKTINEDVKQQSDTNKNITNNVKTQQHTKLRPLGEIFVNGLSRMKLLHYTKIIDTLQAAFL